MASGNGKGSAVDDSRRVHVDTKELARAQAEAAGTDVDVEIRGIKRGRQTRRDRDLWASFQGDIKRPFGRDKQTIAALRLIRDLDPLSSDAVFKYLRLLNPGHDLKAYVFDAEGGETEEQGRAQLALDGWARRVGMEYGGGLDQLLNVLNLMLMTNGAEAAEVAPTPGLDDVEDWYPVDPTLLTFRRMKVKNAAGEQIGEEMVLGQVFANGRFTELNRNQVFYVPLDPDTDDPYGRPPFLAALQQVLSLAQMLNDLRAVAHNQGYPRIDVKVLWEIVKGAAPPHLLGEGKEKDYAEWATGMLNSLVETYKDLQADDTYVHWDYVEVSMVGGSGVGGVGQFDFDALEKILVRQLVSALKMLPILLGINEATSETHGSVQWQIFVAGVEALQRITKRVVEKLANTSLQLQGYQAHAKLEYVEIRTVDRLYEAQAEFIETKTAQEQRRAGWIDNDEAAERMVGHPAVAEPEAPPMLGAGPGNAGDQGGQQPDQTEKQQQTTILPLTMKLLADSERQPVYTSPLAMDRRLASQRARRRPAARQEGEWEPLTPLELDEAVERYADEAVVIFRSLADAVLDALVGEGYDEFETEQRVKVDATVANEIARNVFGLTYSREMKRLLRDAMREGLLRAGIEAPQVQERVVERIWRDNRPFVDRIRDDLKSALRSGAFNSADDVARWFAEEAYREDLMGRFLAKQGYEAGYANGRTILGVDARFTWQLGNAERHCATCQSRWGNRYTYEELISIGFPGSKHLDCAANCKCYLDEVTEAVAA